MKRCLSFFLVFSLIVLLINPFSYDNEVKAAGNLGIINSTCYFRSSPAIKDNNHIYIDGAKYLVPQGYQVSIDGKAYDANGNLWYQVSFTLNGQALSGYVYGMYVTKNTDGLEGLDPAFEEYMNSQGFPESYKPYLRSMHADHPGWIFVADHRNLEWDTLLANEYSRPGNVKNTYQFNGGNFDKLSTDVNYDAATNTWTAVDGGNASPAKVGSWYATTDAVISYYLDPKTYLDETHIFAFESLSYNANVHNIDGVKSILSGTFMEGDNVAINDPNGRTFAQLIMLAAESVGISPYHIAARIRQEMGTTAGIAAKGEGNDRGEFVGIYNYYNIGAVDSSEGNAVTNGLRWASGLDSNGALTNTSYGRPWNSVEKSIVGGASFLNNGYIGNGQDTLYTQKFDLVNFTHQYCTNVQMPYSESYSSYKAYVKMGTIESPFVFKIPVFKNQPDTAGGGHRGDLNGDGKITVVDIVKVQRIIVGLDPLNDSNLPLADVNGDGKVSVADVVFIQRHIVGLQTINW